MLETVVHEVPHHMGLLAYYRVSHVKLEENKENISSSGALPLTLHLDQKHWMSCGGEICKWPEEARYKYWNEMVLHCLKNENRQNLWRNMKKSGNGEETR